MPEQALAGRGIAITRPKQPSDELAHSITQHGGTVALIPLLAIVPLQDHRGFARALEGLADCQWAFFISTNAVEQAMPRVRARYPAWPNGLRVAAIGPTTADALMRAGIREVLTPQGRYDSERLLALPQLQEMAGQRVMLFRGEGGRELLAEQLRLRGAEVRIAECYRRINPQTDAGEFTRLWQNDALQAIVVTSSEAMRHLLELAGDAPWLPQALLCVNHARIAELATQRGLKVALADQPGDAAMLRCLIRHLNTSDTRS